MWNLGNIFDKSLVKFNKDKAGNPFSPSQFQEAIEIINIEEFKRLVGLPEEYTKESPMNSIAYEKTSYVGDRVAALEKVLGGKNFPPLKIDANGYADKPEDYAYQSSMLFPKLSYDESKNPETDFYTIQIVSDEIFSHRLTSTIKKPTIKNPICTFRSDHIEFAPKNLGLARFTYLRWPATPFFDYNVDDGEWIYLAPGELHDGSNLAVGTPSRSVEFEWDALSQVDIINSIVSMAAGKNKDKFTKEMALIREKKGRE